MTRLSTAWQVPSLTTMSPKGASQHRLTLIKFSFFLFICCIKSYFLSSNVPFSQMQRANFLFKKKKKEEEFLHSIQHAPGQNLKKKKKTEIGTDLRMNWDDCKKALGSGKYLQRLLSAKGARQSAALLDIVALREALRAQGTEKGNPTSLLASGTWRSVWHTQAEIKDKFCYL